MFRFFLIRTHLALLATTASFAALAQTTPHAAHGSPAPSSATNTAASESLTYRSAFEGYQSFTDEKVGNWKQVNETVGDIGGWRVYAKEASESADPAQIPHQGDSQAPAQPQNGRPPSRAANPHAGHGKQ